MRYTRGEFLISLLGISPDEILSVNRDQVFLAIRQSVPHTIWETALHETGEDGRPVHYWRICGHYYLDDPTFEIGLVDFLDLAYSSEIGLYMQPNKSILTRANLPPPEANPPTQEPESPFELLSRGPINDLFLAINHYISTADHIGEGVAIPDDDGGLTVCVPYAPRELEDKDNWQRLKARLTQIGAQEPTLKLTVQEGPKAPGGFVIGQIHLDVGDVPRLTALLKAEPGPLGWGSMYTFLQSHGLAGGKTP